MRYLRTYDMVVEIPGGEPEHPTVLGMTVVAADEAGAAAVMARVVADRYGTPMRTRVRTCTDLRRPDMGDPRARLGVRDLTPPRPAVRPAA